MLTLGGEIPVEGRGDLLLPEQVGVFGLGEQPAPVDPGAEIGRDRDVGRSRHDARGKLAVAAREFVQHQTEALLGRHLGGLIEREPLRHVDRGRVQAAASLAIERRIGEERLQLRGLLRKPLEFFPLVARADILGGAPLLHLRHRHQPCMVVLVALERKADALDGIGDEADGAIMIDRLESLDHGSHVVAAEIGHQRQ